MQSPRAHSTTASAVCAALLIGLLAAAPARAIPATPLMTVYRFDAPLEVPYYDADRFLRSGPSAPVGSLAQGTSVIPCLVLRGGRPVTDRDGTPYVGFEIVVDARQATPEATARFTAVAAERQALRVVNHHCADDVRNVIDVRALVARDAPPRFDPPPGSVPPASAAQGGSELDQLVRAFHASPQCAAANARLIGRREVA